jgi:hypothetical protein
MKSIMCILKFSCFDFILEKEKRIIVLFVFRLILKQNDLLKFDRDGTAIIIPSLMKKKFNDVFQLYYSCPKKIRKKRDV